jgi:hypothetical protein
MSTSPFALLPAMPFDDLKLEEVGDDVRQRFNDLILGTDFLEATTMRNQVGVRITLGSPAGEERFVRQIAAFYGIGKGCVQNHFSC